MISWLQGQQVEHWNQGSRQGVVLSCGGVGYEVQLLSRDLIKIEESKKLTLWIHQVQREDGPTALEKKG